MRHFMRIATLGLAASTMLSAPAVVQAGSHSKAMDCTIEISRKEMGFIVTIGGGSGTLTCDGKSHALRVGGLQIGAAGISSMEATGTVMGLGHIEDIEGTYSRLEAGATLVKGGGKIDLANSKGVKMNLNVESAGADVKLGGGGLKIRLDN